MRTLHDYQNDALTAIRAALRPGAQALLHVATGGGKTCIANALVAEHLEGAKANNVLWVTKDGALLDQAMLDLREHHPQWAAVTCRIGSPSRATHLAERPEAPKGRVAYTTLHTLRLRFRDRRLNNLRPTLIVWDECHWADGQPLGRAVRDLGRSRNSALLGLTATPRSPEWSIFPEPTYSKPFGQLVEEGRLARPVIHSVATGVKWSPTLGSVGGEITPASLREIADSPKRNKLIVKTFTDGADEYGQTLIFACTIDHADKIGQMLQRAGVACDVVHTDVDDPHGPVDRFRNGKVRVLVNVAMLTHGIDIPSIRTVFLCRPTNSAALFMQMIGRGSRKDKEDPEKQTFNIVEFNDTVEKHADRLVNTDTEFASQPSSSVPTGPRGPQLKKHSFDPSRGPLHVPKLDGIPPGIQELWYRQGQTFGVEIELTRDGWENESPTSWLRTAEGLRQVLLAVLGQRYVCDHPADYDGSKSDDVWNVERDGSCGWEITTRILEGEAGLKELADVCIALDAALTPLGLRVAPVTGLHVHLGWDKAAPLHLPRLLRLVRLFEPGLGTLVAPSRLRHHEGMSYAMDEPNRFARPVACTFSGTKLAGGWNGIELAELAFDDQDAKYSTFNVRPLQSKRTVEVRMHSGTTEIGKIATWTSLWMQLLWAAEQPGREVPEVPDAELIEPNADILGLAREWLPDGKSPAFVSRLRQRRAQVLASWAWTPQLKEWLQASEAWTRSGAAPRQAPAPQPGIRGLVAAHRRPPPPGMAPVTEVLARLESEGVLRGLAVEPGDNGWGVVHCERPGGHGPILHLWDHSHGSGRIFKVWVYLKPPPRAGFAPFVHTEIEAPTEAKLEALLRQIMAAR